MPDVDLNSTEVKQAIADAVSAATREATAGLQASIDTAVGTATEGLKTKNQELLGEVKKFKTKSKVVPDGFDPVKYQEMLDANAAADEEAAKAAGKWDEYKAELVETHKTEMATLRTENESLHGQLENVLVTNEIMSAISKAKGNSDLLMPHVRKHVKLIEEEGAMVARVIDKAGNARIAGAEGDFMTISGLLDEFKATDVYAPCFEGSRATGSGAGGSGGSGGADNNPFAKDTLNLTEQARLRREDPQAATRLQKAAG